MNRTIFKTIAILLHLLASAAPAATWIDGSGLTQGTTLASVFWSASVQRVRDSQHPIKVAGNVTRLTLNARRAAWTAITVECFRGGTAARPATRVWTHSFLTTDPAYSAINTDNYRMDFTGLTAPVEVGDQLAFSFTGAGASDRWRVNNTEGSYYSDANSADGTTADWTLTSGTCLNWSARIDSEENLPLDTTTTTTPIKLPVLQEEPGWIILDDVKVQPGDTLTLTFQNHNPVNVGYTALRNAANTQDVAIVLNMAANTISFCGTAVNLQATTKTLNETVANTTWSNGGLTMTGTGSAWNTAGATLVRAGDKVRISAGTGVTAGDYRVSSVNSDTSITLGSSPGATPSSVTYTILRDEARDNFTLAVWFDMANDACNLIWCNKNTGAGGKVNGSYDITWRSHAVAADGSNTRGKYYATADQVTASFDQVVRRIAISGTGTIGKAQSARRPVIVMTDSFSSNLDTISGGSQIAGVGSYIGASFTYPHAVFHASIAGNALTFGASSMHAISARYGLRYRPGADTDATASPAEDYSTPGIHDICEMPAVIIALPNGPSTNDMGPVDADVFLAKRTPAKMLGALGNMIAWGTSAGTSVTYDVGTSTIVGYGQEWILCEMAYRPEPAANEANVNGAIAELNRGLRTLASVTRQPIATIANEISARSVTGVGLDAVTYFGGFRDAYRQSFDNVHPAVAGYQLYALRMAQAYERGGRKVSTGESVGTRMGLN